MERGTDVFRTKPILVVFGEQRDAAVTVPGFSWATAFEDCQTFVAEVNAAGGSAKMLHLPTWGIRAKSHLLTMELNSLEIADLLINWIEENEPS